MGLLLRRLLQIVPTIILVAILTFVLIHLLPGDPAVAMLGDRATPELVDQLRRQMGLDHSLLAQFGIYVGNLARLRLGRSIATNVPVTTLIASRLPVTLLLTAMAAAIALLLAVPLALFAAFRRGGLVDTLILMTAQVGLSMPVFYLGLVLLIVFGAGLRWFPIGGIGDGLLSDLYHLFLPALTLALSLAAILMRSLRASLITLLDAEFVTFARAKGLRRRLVIGRHLLRNALASTVSLFGLQIGTLIGGAVVTETVYAVPGAGRLMVDSIYARDYAVVQGLTLVLALLVSLAFLAVDALHALIDPRIA